MLEVRAPGVPRRVLMLGWEYPPHITGGLGTACQGLASALARRGVDVTFLLPWLHADEPDDGVRLVAAGIDDAPAPYGDATPAKAHASARSDNTRRARYAGNMVQAAARFAASAAKLAWRETFDVVHAHDWTAVPAGIAAAASANAPLVVHVHSCEHDRSGPSAAPEIVAIEQAGFDAASRIVCVSRYTASVVRKHYDVDPAKLRVVHNAGPAGRVRARRGRRRIAEPVVLFLGRLTYQKGPERFLEAAAIVSQTRSDVRFVVAGTGDLYHRTIERAAALGVGACVHFTGFLGAADVARAYRESDIYVMPSVSEPFGIAPIEAARHGVAVLVSENSGVAEVLPSAITFDPHDSADLAAALLRVLSSTRLRKRLAQRGRTEAAALRWETQAKNLDAVYGEIARADGESL
ncbi:MAG: glycosyltransferase family 4 protein [Planctomycetes bacterium]|nr:glycosyltransferase family 4 protein [Planctomycetota bacterium]